MDLKTKLVIACLGALSPILASLLALDFDLILTNATPLTVTSYVIRQLTLCAAACLCVYLSPDARRPMTIFQLGIAAPAIIIGIINGVSQSHNLRPRIGFQIPAIVGTAFAQPAPRPDGALPTGVRVEDCLRRESTVSQQIIKGVLGILPEDRWFVVISSNLQLQTAINDVQEIQQKFSGRFQAKICGPVSADNRYRVVIGQNLTYDAATRLKDEAKAAGLPIGTWLWSPLQQNSG